MLVYVTKFFWWEAGYWNTMDIAHDRGLHICFIFVFVDILALSYRSADMFFWRHQFSQFIKFKIKIISSITTVFHLSCLDQFSYIIDKFIVYIVFKPLYRVPKSCSWILYLLGLFGLGSISVYISWNVPCQPSSESWHPGTIPFLFELLFCGSYLYRRVFLISNILFKFQCFPLFFENQLPCLSASTLYFSGWHYVHIHQL